MSEAPSNLAAQVRVSKMLGLGFACSIVWSGGVSSLIAFVVGLRAMKIIKQYHGEIGGSWMAWWCIVVGAIGTTVTLPHTVWLLVKAVNQ
jgi:undecaprenyl pyrophosphate phosphatase UppP